MKPVLDKRNLLVVRRLSRRVYASAPPARLMVFGVTYGNPGRPTVRRDVLDLLTARQEGSFTQESTMRVDTLQPVGGGEQAGFGPLPAVTDHLSGAKPRKPCKNPRKKCPRNLRGSCQPLGNVWTRSI